MENHKPFIKYVPNLLTVFRLLLVPVFYYAFWRPGFLLPDRFLACLVFVTAVFTDWLDGVIARKYNASSNFGKLMDPLADKLMTIMALFCFYVSGLVDWLFLAIVILKELAMVVGGYVLLTYQIVVYSKMCGKVAACLFYLAIVMTFFPQVWPWNTYVLYAALALMVYSFFFYLRDGIRQLRQRKREGKTLKGQQKQPKGQK